MSGVKPLKLKQERILPASKVASENPVAKVLVQHSILHLETELDYLISAELDESVKPGILVEVEVGPRLTQGVVLARGAHLPPGKLKFIEKALSRTAYVNEGQLSKTREIAGAYGVSPWEIIASTIPPFSKMGEKAFLNYQPKQDQSRSTQIELPQELANVLSRNRKLHCAIELPVAFPYWKIVSDVARLRSRLGIVLLLLPNERELRLAEEALRADGEDPLVLVTSAGKSDRYFNYLVAQSATRRLILGTRSSALLQLPAGSTIVIQDDGDEGFYERSAPTWNARDLITAREDEHSTIFIGSSPSLETAERVASHKLGLYTFPTVASFKITSAAQEKREDYFHIIRKGLEKGSVLVSVGSPGYITSFTCQRCRNIARCDCGGKLYIPHQGRSPLCSVCAKERLNWSCPWCGGTSPRRLKSGAHRRADEFGRAFPQFPVLTSTGTTPVPSLPEGRHLVISTPGVEPRGVYEAGIFLDLEGRLGRTTLRSSEEVRLHVFRTLSMMKKSAPLYFDLEQSHLFLQSILRFNPFYAAEKELADRHEAHLPPTFATFLLSNEKVDVITKLFEERPGVEVIGPFLRQGKKVILVKVARERKEEIINLISSANRVLSLRKAPLITFYCDPYSLN